MLKIIVFVVKKNYYFNFIFGVIGVLYENVFLMYICLFVVICMFVEYFLFSLIIIIILMFILKRYLF